MSPSSHTDTEPEKRTQDIFIFAGFALVALPTLGQTGHLVLCRRSNQQEDGRAAQTFSEDARGYGNPYHLCFVYTVDTLVITAKLQLRLRLNEDIA